MTAMAAGATPRTQARDPAAWRESILAALGAGGRFAGLFGTAEPVGCRVTALVATPAGVEQFSILVAAREGGVARYPALTAQVPAAFWYERALHDLFGVVPTGHPRLEPLLLVVPDGAPSPRPGAPASSPRLRSAERSGPVDVSGRGVFTIAFGPVRSGVTESVEFLIETPGEDVPHLTIRPHFKHRGIAKAFEGRTVRDAVLVAERVEGVASVAHALAFSHAVEAIDHIAVPPAAARWRLVFAELERIANHLDVLARSADAAGLAVAAARFGWHKEKLLRLVTRLCGNRFGRGVVIPGGIVAAPSVAADDAAAELAAAHRRIRRDCAALMGTASFLDRVRGTGRLDPVLARSHGALGPVGRGSGFDDDDRRRRPYDAYTDFPPGSAALADPALAGPAGDAAARLRLRIAEIDVSAGLVAQALAELHGAAGTVRTPVEPAGGTGLGWAEGPQGEELYSVELVDGRVRRCFARSASLHNLVLLHEVFHGDVLTDFPFIEASFGLCYAGVAM